MAVRNVSWVLSKGFSKSSPTGSFFLRRNSQDVLELQISVAIHLTIRFKFHCLHNSLKKRWRWLRQVRLTRKKNYKFLKQNWGLELCNYSWPTNKIVTSTETKLWHMEIFGGLELSTIIWNEKMLCYIVATYISSLVDSKIMQFPQCDYSLF